MSWCGKEKYWCLSRVISHYIIHENMKFYAPTMEESLLSHPFSNLYFQLRCLPKLYTHDVVYISIQMSRMHLKLNVSQNPTLFYKCAPPIICFFLNCTFIFLSHPYLICSASPVSSASKHGPPLPPLSPRWRPDHLSLGISREPPH